MYIPEQSPTSRQYRSSLTDKEWSTFAPIFLEKLPKKKQTKPLKWTHREWVDAMLYHLKNGCNWVDLPKDFPPYSTVYWHYRQWKENGVFDKLMQHLHGDVREHIKKKKMDKANHD